MDAIELNDILNALVSAVRNRMHLNTDSAIATVMLSDLAENLRQGKVSERNIDNLYDSLVSEINFPRSI